MLLVERVIHTLSPHGHSHTPLPTTAPSGEGSSHVEFDADVELDELEREQGAASGSGRTGYHHSDAVDKATAYPLTLGLMVHALADGFALGSSATSPVDRGLSLTVFLALIIHKGVVSSEPDVIFTC